MNIKGFKLGTVILIIVITSVISAITTGVIINSIYKNISGISYYEILEDDNLAEFLMIYLELKENFYGEYDEIGMLAIATETLENYSGDNESEAIELALEAMLEYLGDDYTTFLDSDAYDYLSSELEGTYEGIGITVSGNEIVSVATNSPAEESGLLKGDIIIEVNGQVIESSYSYFISYIISNATGSIEIVVLRDSVEYTFTTYKTTLDSSTQYYMVDDSNTGYIYLSVFSDNCYESFYNALLDLESLGMENLIIDLRDNGGGYLNKAIEIASIFLEEGDIINSLVSNDGKTINYDETNESRNYDIILLMNEKSASASEILAAALVDNEAAKIIGTQSYGKGTVQQLIESNTGTSAKYTTAYWYTPNNVCINGIGIEPTYYVELEYEEDSEGNIISVIDTQLNMAIEILKGA